MDSKTCHRFEVRLLNMVGSALHDTTSIAPHQNSFDRARIDAADMQVSEGASESHKCRYTIQLSSEDSGS